MKEMLKFMRMPDVSKTLGLGKTAIYDRIKDGVFPPSIKLGYNVVVWPSHEIREIMQTYVSGQTDAQRQALVKILIKRREVNPDSQPSHASSLSFA